MQNQNRLKFWIKDFYVDIYLLMAWKDDARIREQTFNITAVEDHVNKVNVNKAVIH